MTLSKDTIQSFWLKYTTTFTNEIIEMVGCLIRALTLIGYHLHKQAEASRLSRILIKKLFFLTIPKARNNGF